MGDKDFFPEMFHPEVLAKSSGQSLTQHINKTLSVLESILNTSKFFIENVYFDDIRDNLRLALVIHDIGKISSKFQSVLKKHNINERWDYRHEILSISILLFLNSDYKFFNNQLDYSFFEFLAILSVLTHHKTISYLRNNYNPSNKYAKRKLISVFKEITNLSFLNDFFKYVFLEKKINFSKSTHLISMEALKKLSFINEINEITCPDYYSTFLKPWNKLFEDFNLNWNNKFFSKDESNMLIQIFFYSIIFRGCILTCDHLGSANFDAIKIETIPFHYHFKKNHPDWQLNEIQDKILKIKGDCFIFAPTAFGKTEAALLWADANKSKYKGERIFYALPYTASCNKMFERLEQYFGMENIGILHNKSHYFVYKYMSQSEEDFSKKELIEYTNKKRDLMKKNYLPIKIITPFQLLKLFFGYSGFEASLLELVNAKIIFDEIHVYDPITMGQILITVKFLKNLFSVQFLFMTATLPKFLLNAFKKILNIPEDDNRCIISVDESILKSRIRHKIRLYNGKMFSNEKISDFFLNSILNDLHLEKKVLIVCNSIKTAKNTYSSLEKEKTLINIISKREIGLLHGELTLKDREEVEKRVNDFKILIGTQAIEVSLDIDYNSGYFEIAPIDALIQRAGRINRTNKRKIPETIIIFDEDSLGIKTVYSLKRIEYTKKLLEDFIEKQKNNYLNKSSNEEFHKINDFDYNQLVQQLYKDGYDEKEEKDFIFVQEKFKNFISKYLRPCEADPRLYREFEDMFDLKVVIPQKYKEFYKISIDNKNFYEAIQYTLNISKYKYFKFTKMKKIYYDEILEILVTDIPYIDGFGFEI